MPQQPANITSGLPYLGEDNVFYMLPPRDNTSYQGAFNEFYYDLPINHLPGIHWCAPPVRGWCRMGAPFSPPVPNHRICSVTIECALVRLMHSLVVAVPALVATKCACRACAGSTPT